MRRREDSSSLRFEWKGSETDFWELVGRLMKKHGNDLAVESTARERTAVTAVRESVCSSVRQTWREVHQSGAGL